MSAWDDQLSRGTISYDPKDVSFSWMPARWSLRPSRLGVLVNPSSREVSASSDPILGGPGSACCQLEDPGGMIRRFAGLELRFQRPPYTPTALLAVASRHKSALDKADLVALLRLARALEERIVWWSGPRSGATQYHLHFQAHRRSSLGGTLPIEDAQRTTLVHSAGIRIARLAGYPLNALSLRLEDDARAVVQVAMSCLEELHGPCNLVVGRRELLIVGRRADHSPLLRKRLGGAEVAGVFVFASEPPADLEFDLLAAAMEEVGLTDTEHNAWEERIKERLTATIQREPA